VRHGFRWWEIDPRALSWLGVVWDLKTPPAAVLLNEQRLGSRVIDRAAELLASRFNPERIALAIASALHRSELSALQETLGRARDRTTEVLAGLHLPQLPSREEFRRAPRLCLPRPDRWTKSSTAPTSCFWSPSAGGSRVTMTPILA